MDLRFDLVELFSSSDIIPLSISVSETVSGSLAISGKNQQIRKC